MFDVSTTSFHTSPKSFREAQYGFVDRVLWQLVAYQLQNFLELIDVLDPASVEMTCSVQAYLPRHGSSEG